MTESIIVAILALFGTLAGSFFSNSKTVAVMDEKIKGVKEDIGRLDTKVYEHNKLIERMTVVERDLKAAHNRIDELKEREN
jgi:cell division protein FtsB